MDRQIRERILASSDSQLLSRLRRMRNPSNLAAFIRALRDCDRQDVAEEAQRRLDTVTAASSVEVPTDEEPPQEVAPEAAKPRARRPRRSGTDAGVAPGEPDEATKRHWKRRMDELFAAKAAREKEQLFKETVARKLAGLGMEVYFPDAGELAFDWDMLAGYDEVKRQVEETVVLALSHPEVYDEIATATRGPDVQPGANRPRAVLFEGPPGTGKTTCARIIAEQGEVPLVNVRLEHILSKWYGEDEQRLAEVLALCEALGTAVVFLDELDSAMSSRDGHVHETTKRMLGILLRHLDGMDRGCKRGTVFIGATNRKADLDPALRSRFATSIRFDLPDEQSRAAILRCYARQLADSEVSYLAKQTAGLAGQDLRAVCELTERRWAAEVIKGAVPRGQLPSVLTYMKGVEQRLVETQGDPDGRPPGAGRGIRLR